MLNKSQILCYIQIFASLVLAFASKILNNIITGDSKDIFAFLNIFALIIFVKGIINMIELKYDIKILNFKSYKKSVD